MINYRKARKDDLPAIRYLAQESSKFDITSSMLNNRDIALLARDEDSGALVGFLWCGLMCQNERGYVDKFMVSKEHSGKQIGAGLFKMLLLECAKRKVKQFTGSIVRDENHDKVCKSILKIGAGGSELPYTLAYVNVEHSISELIKLGAI